MLFLCEIVGSSVLTGFLVKEYYFGIRATVLVQL